MEELREVKEEQFDVKDYGRNQDFDLDLVKDEVEEPVEDYGSNQNFDMDLVKDEVEEDPKEEIEEEISTIPKFLIVGTLKRKRAEDEEQEQANFERIVEIEFSERKISNSNLAGNKFPKLEEPEVSDNSMKEVKEEPLGEGPSTSGTNYSNPEMEEPKVEDVKKKATKISVTPSDMESIGLHTPYCCLCGIIESKKQHLTNVPLKSELLILATGFILAGKLTNERGKDLMTRKQSTYSCPEHYRQADEQILTALKKVESALFRNDDTDSMAVLMPIVSVICPQMSKVRLSYVFADFHAKLHQRKNTTVNTSATARCSLCNRRQIPENLIEVHQKGIKYLLALSSVFQGYRNTKQAIEFASGNFTKRVCHFHQKATLNVILERLKIKNVNELPKAENFNNVMGVVQKIWTGCTEIVFSDTFRWFATKQAVKSYKSNPYQPPRHAFPEAAPVCSLCCKISSTTEIVKEKNTKLVLVMGACLSRQMGIAKAKRFMAGNGIKPICKAHFTGSITEILEGLQISSFQEFPTKERAEYVTNMANTICSTKFLYKDFVDTANTFLRNFQR